MTDRRRERKRKREKIKTHIDVQEECLTYKPICKPRGSEIERGKYKDSTPSFHPLSPQPRHLVLSPHPAPSPETARERKASCPASARALRVSVSRSTDPPSPEGDRGRASQRLLQRKRARERESKSLLSCLRTASPCVRISRSTDPQLREIELPGHNGPPEPLQPEEGSHRGTYGATWSPGRGKSPD